METYDVKSNKNKIISSYIKGADHAIQKFKEVYPILLNPTLIINSRN